MTDASVRAFYDRLAPDYHLLFPDWDASMARQAAALEGLLSDRLGPGQYRVLDCACGIGTQAIGLARRGHRVLGADLSSVSVRRARAEAAARGTAVPVAVADMRRLPFAARAFDAVVCADNALPHLLSAEDVRAALSGMRRVLREGGVLAVTVRDYDAVLRERPTSTPPQVAETPAGRVVTFQLWHWHDDGERYDLEHFQLHPAASGWDVRVRRTTYWALTRGRLGELAAEAGFTDLVWHAPTSSDRQAPKTGRGRPDAVGGGFYQPVLTARRAPSRPAR